MKSPFSKEFLFEYFSGNASSLQKKMIDEWMKVPQNEEIFYRYLEEWETTFPQYITDVQKAISRYHSSLNQREIIANEEAKGGFPILRPLRRTWLYVASFLLICGAGCWFFRDPFLYIRYQTRPGQVATWVLPDGSRATLNANSVLKVPRFWPLFPERQVGLSGEAEFAVTHTKDDRKFTVKTGNNLDIVVLGTVFTVFNRRHRTHVTLNKGKVRLERQSGKKHEALSMLPGDRVVVEEGKAMHRTRDLSQTSYAPWKKSRFEFNETPFYEVAQLISDNYSIEVKFENEEIAHQTLTGSFVAISAPHFLDAISQMADLRYERSGNKVHFRKNP